MFHFCHEELFAILAAIPMIRMIVPYLKAKFHKLTGKCDHEPVNEPECSDAIEEENKETEET